MVYEKILKQLSLFEHVCFFLNKQFLGVLLMLQKCEHCSTLSVYSMHHTSYTLLTSPSLYFLVKLVTANVSCSGKLLRGHKRLCPLSLLKLDRMSAAEIGCFGVPLERCLFTLLSVKLFNFLGTFHAPKPLFENTNYNLP